MPPYASRRDPLSEWFDGKSRELLRRAYARREQWTGSYLAPPTPEQRARASLMGIYNLYERDRWGEVRWVRAYKRSVYYQMKRHGSADAFRPGHTRMELNPATGKERPAKWPGAALEWETVGRASRPGWLGRGWEIRVSVHSRGTASYRAAVASSTYWPGSGLQSTADDHDWE